MSLDLEFQLRAERTPNPQSVKWVVHPALATTGRSVHFREAPAAGVSPLADRLFAISGVRELLITSDFVTVTKEVGADWPALAEPLSRVLREFVGRSAEVFGPESSEILDLGSPAARDGDDPLTREIRDFLDREIRPLIARDGGDLLFVDFRDGSVSLVLQGACSGCPRSTQTLKFGIEQRLREAIPAVREVVAL